MSNTIVDMPKVTQMLDAGWSVKMFLGGMGSYTAVARRNGKTIVTDDFTPEQAITRLAYKVIGGEVI